VTRFTASAMAGFASRRSLSDLRLPLIAAISWVSALLLVGFHIPLWIVATLWVVVGGGILVVAGRSWRERGLTPLAGAVLLAGVMLVSVGLHSELRHPDVMLAAEGQSTTLRVHLTSTIAPGDRHLDGAVVEFSGIRVPGVPVMLFIPEATSRLSIGSTVEVTSALRRVGNWDSRGWTGNASELVVIAPAPPLFAGADRLREAFLVRSLERGGDGGALLPGLALGDTTGVPEDLEADMRQAALAHLVAVSGANCALVVGLAVWLTALCGGSVRWRWVTGSLALVGFVVLVTPEPSVIRAAVMAVIVLGALAIGRPFRGLQVLSLTVWVLLLTDPWRSIEVAFVLSVAATGGILLGFQPLTSGLSRLMPRPMAMVLALPLAAQLAVQPVIILLRPSIPLWGLLANVLAAPAAPLVTLFGVLGALTGPIAPPVAQLFTWLGWFPATWIAGIARATARLPLQEIPWLEGAVGLVVLALVGALVFLALNSRHPSRAAGAALAVAASALVAAWGPVGVMSVRVPDGWSIAQCDVGQGDAVVYRADATVVLVDTGDDEELLERCLSILRIDRVDVLILTHFDRDHVGASAALHGRVGEVWTGPTDNDEDRRRLQDLFEAGAVIAQVGAGNRLSAGSVVADVLWPTAIPLSAPGNDSSVVVVLQGTHACTGCPSLMVLGDLGETTQRMLAGRMADRRVDVVKVSHHGSPDQYPELYRELGGLIALIGVGADNGYGHPDRGVVDFLERLDYTVVRSDQDGTAVVYRGEDNLLRVWQSGGR
jgi:competence protein ComEC